MSRPQLRTYTIEVGSITIQVTHKRVKNVNVRIGPDGSARMSVPARMSVSRAKELAREYAPWFEQHRQKRADRQAPQPIRWETGEVLRVWGEDVTVRVEPCDGKPTCMLVADALVADALVADTLVADMLVADALVAGSPVEGAPSYPTPNADKGVPGANKSVLVLRVPASSSPPEREAVVEAWLAGQLRERLTTLLPECEAEVGRRATAITLRRMKTRWGSCTPKTGRIRLNTALAECKPACLRMVLVHELCHLIELNHGPRFHALMDLHCPDWRASQRWLNEHPPRVASI